LSVDQAVIPMMFSCGWGAAAGGGAEARTLHNVSRAALPGPPSEGPPLFQSRSPIPASISVKRFS